jgi:hypothetical protein
MSFASAHLGFKKCLILLVELTRTQAQRPVQQACLGNGEGEHGASEQGPDR